VDDWEKYLDVMVDSIFLNSGRGCINCSGIWASRHTKEIAQALAERIGPVEPKPPEDPQASLAAFTVPGAAKAIWKSIEAGLNDGGTEHLTARFGPRLVEKRDAEADRSHTGRQRNHFGRAVPAATGRCDTHRPP
jgi:acyl-CoA reductase-like NAD-dependent aldehyde dehydrogenase